MRKVAIPAVMALVFIAASNDPGQAQSHLAAPQQRHSPARQPAPAAAAVPAPTAGAHTKSPQPSAAGRSAQPGPNHAAVRQTATPASFQPPPFETHEWTDFDAGYPPLMAGPGCADCSSCYSDGCYTHMVPAFWFQAEYLLWWTKGMQVPPLVTTSPANTPSAESGVLGAPGTQILFGDSGLTSDSRSGGRFALGLWLDSPATQGIDVTYMFLGEEGSTFFASPINFPILARPFLEASTGQQDARLINFPGLVTGTLDVRADTHLQGLELLYRCVLRASPCARTDYFVGYRWLELQDDLRISESTLAVSGPLQGTTFDLFDHFGTLNSFHGGQFGTSLHWQRLPGWSWELMAKVALGNTRSRTHILGQTVTTVDGQSATREGGLLTQPTNIGTFERNSFSAVGEFGITLRRHFACGVSTSFGYRFLGWTDVVRAGQQVDLSVNTTQIPPSTITGPLRPRFPGQSSDFWAQGLHFGLEYAY